MKKNKLFIGVILSAVVLIGTSCEKMDKKLNGDFEGTYVGLFSESTSLKSTKLDSNGENDGVAEITLIGDDQIQVHCFGNEFDTTFVLNYFEHNDSIMVCLTGYDFESTYGHMYGSSHMSGGMMGDMGQGETEWMHHMNDEHQDGDEHFGGFNMHEGTFSYSFRMIDNLTPYYLTFHGTKD